MRLSKSLRCTHSAAVRAVYKHDQRTTTWVLTAHSRGDIEAGRKSILKVSRDMKLVNCWKFSKPHLRAAMQLVFLMLALHSVYCLPQESRVDEDFDNDSNPTQPNPKFSFDQNPSPLGSQNDKLLQDHPNETNSHGGGLVEPQEGSNDSSTKSSYEELEEDDGTDPNLTENESDDDNDSGPNLSGEVLEDDNDTGTNSSKEMFDEGYENGSNSTDPNSSDEELEVATDANHLHRKGFSKYKYELDKIKNPALFSSPQWLAYSKGPFFLDPLAEITALLDSHSISIVAEYQCLLYGICSIK
ncbi:uncharacterized protein LOC108675373 [Hyalella azteca]|uniref:Uncharacterized protein LOC108675373 n=1 Tax=Hyalella azteca TaxID=294128 RepID=A0A8B7P1B3_HYAAZ|nr:uncharacterized protein LOC108675373 [Hyalella azteca]